MMHIGWSFVDTQKAAHEAVLAYRTMEGILQCCKFDIEKIRANMDGIGSPAFSKMPSANNPHSGEDRIIRGMERLEDIPDRQRRAQEYMNWFKPAWDQLTEDERFVLDAYKNGKTNLNSLGAIARRFDVAAGTASNMRSRALERLACLLYGKE